MLSQNAQVEPFKDKANLKENLNIVVIKIKSFFNKPYYCIKNNLPPIVEHKEKFQVKQGAKNPRLNESYPKSTKTN